MPTPARATSRRSASLRQCHGLVVLDAAGEVIRPAKLWNDTTSTPELMYLRAQIGDQTLIQRTGSLPTAAFTLSKVAWLARHEPANFARVAHLMLPHDYLTYRLTGRAVTDRSEASGTAYFDASRDAYLVEHLQLIARPGLVADAARGAGSGGSRRDRAAGRARPHWASRDRCWSVRAAATSMPPPSDSASSRATSSTRSAPPAW